MSIINLSPPQNWHCLALGTLLMLHTVAAHAGITITGTTASGRAIARRGVNPDPTTFFVIRWINPASDSFQIATNWDPQQVPTGADDAAFDLAGTYTVSLDADVAHHTLFGNGFGVNATFQLNGHTYTVDRLQTGGLSGENASFTFSGVFAPAILGGPQQAGGGLVRVIQDVLVAEGTKQSYIEQARVSSPLVNVEGLLTIAGNGTLFEASQLNIGIEGEDAELTINSGGRIVSTKATVGVEPGGILSSGGVGTVALNSISSWRVNAGLTVGKGGTGTVGVRDGSNLTAQGLSILGEENGSTGTLEVSGGGSLFKASSLKVGLNGTGTLSVRASGRLEFDNLDIGERSDGIGTVTVNGNGSKLIVTNILSVGGFGDGTLTIEASGFAEQSGSVFQGKTTVGNNGEILVQGQGEGRFRDLDVESGGTIRAGSGGLIRIDEKLDIQGTGTARVDPAGRINVGQGDGAVGKLRIGPGGVLSGNGTVIAAEIVTAGSGSNQFTGGQILPANSPGTLTLEGNFTQEPGSRLVVEAAGVNAGQFDVLHVTGNTTLGGTLEVMFLDGYLPKTDDSFGFLEIDGSISGDFAEVVFPQLLPGFEIKTEMVDGKYQLTALNDGVRRPVKGIFHGVLNGDPAGHAAAGFFTIQITARGGFSARFVLGGRKFALSGKFDASGKFSGSIPRTGDSPLMITLELPLDGSDVITGTISDGVHTIPISAGQTSAFKPKKNPAPQAGKYTAVLQFDSTVSEAPQADGIGAVVVSKSGAIRFAGALADGTRLSQGTELSKSGEWPLFVLLYKKQGSLFGALQFRDETGSDFDGLVRWSRPPTPDDKIQTAGFFATLPTIGSRYVAPPARPAVLDLPTGATATLSDTDLTPALTKSLTLTPPNKFLVINPGADQFSLRAKTSNGLLSPRFIHPTTGLLTKGQGVVFQKQNFGSGFFLRPGRIGSFDLQANP